MILKNLKARTNKKLAGVKNHRHSFTYMKVELTDVIDILRDKLEEEKVQELLTEFNARLKDEIEEEEGDKEPKEKQEFSFYRIFDESVKTSEGVCPEFVIKVDAETLPTDIEARLQHALNNVKDEQAKKGKGKRGRKGKLREVKNLYDLLNSVSKKHFEPTQLVKVVTKEPVIDLPINLTF